MVRDYQHKIEEIGRLVVAEFSNTSVVEHFTASAEMGLWPSEQTLITRHFRPRSRVLDLGCGVGRTTLPLARAGFEVLGVDISSRMIVAAEQLASTEGVPIQYEVGDAINLRFDDGTFDHVVFSNQGWTQIPGNHNRLAALCEIRRVLSNGGSFLFSTHTRPCAVIHPTWAWRWLRWYVQKTFDADREEINFGDLLFVRSLPVAHSMKQYVHIPTRTQVQRLLRSQSFQLLETIREHSVRHDPLVYIAKLDVERA